MAITLDGTNGITTPDLAVDTNTLFVDAANNLVGVGTDNPTTKLDVVSSTNAGIRVSDGTHTGVMFPSAVGGVVYGTTSNHPAVFFSNNAERARIAPAGEFLVAKTTSSELVDGVNLSAIGVRSTSLSDPGVFYRRTADSVGVILTKSDIGGTNTLVGAGFTNGTFGTISDERKKKNIETARGYLDDLMQIRVVKYNWITDEETAPKELGWIAQEVEQVFPGMVSEMEGSKILKKEVFVPMLLKAIQEQQAIIKALEARVAALETPA